MFYSQFILAKKGPLGTIWIAAHLERKLRKNQVADTDIGVSVDSILFPEMPIALRLSSHLLLGVVRIYSRKVNYLFDDCSEALLKIKQAFRSTAVDLPPEESTAPYHSITLPETFDLDDFELPDSDIFQGNYVDHHISSRDQITLQDTMEGVVYSTSKFGLDERFGDGDASGLDLDEELFVQKDATAGHTVDTMNTDVDLQESVQATSALKHDEVQGAATVSEATAAGVGVNQIEDFDGDNEPVEYAQAPCTPGLWEEPNLSNIQETSACDDHQELENHNVTESVVKENLKDANRKETGYFSGDQEHNQSEPQEKSLPAMLTAEHTSMDDLDSTSFTDSFVADQVRSISPKDKVSDAVTFVSDGPDRVEELPNGTSRDKDTGVQSLDDNHENCVELQGDMENKCHPVAELEPNTEPFHKDGMLSSTLPIIRPCVNHLNNSDTNVGSSANPDIPSDVAALHSLVTSAGEEPATASGDYVLVQGEEPHSNDPLEQNLQEIHVTEPAPHNELQEAYNLSNERVDNVVPGEDQLDSAKSSLSDFPAPEKLLSVPEGISHVSKDLLLETPVQENIGEGDGGDAGNDMLTGKKRSYTESSLVTESSNLDKSSGLFTSKITAECVPDDDDLLSSILVGRRSSVLKMKPTPLLEKPSTKRRRTAPRSGISKRKVLMDDNMVLHGDTIRQQLTNTEDIRRLRKKAPCTRPEISMIQRQFWEDELFNEAIFTGVSMELASLHHKAYDLSKIKVSQNDEHGRQLEARTEKNMDVLVTPNVLEENGVEANFDAVAREDVCEAQPIETPLMIDNQPCEDYTINPDLHDIQTPIHITSDVEHDGQRTVMDTDGKAISDVEIESLIHATDTVPNDVCDMSAAVGQVEKTSEAGASLQMDAQGVQSDEKVDLLSAELDPSIEIRSNKSEADIATEIKDDLASVKETSEEKHGVLVEGVEYGTSVEILRDITDCLDHNQVANIFTTCSSDADDLRCRIAAVDQDMEEIRRNEEGFFNENAVLDSVECNAHDMASNGICNEELATVSMYDEEVNLGLKGVSFDGGENPETQDTYPSTATNVEDTSANDRVDGDELDYSAVANDTDFLNFDDDEDDPEVAGDYVPEAEATRFIDNSGWSSRTKAVAKYLQVMFDKEAERGRKVIPMNNMLVGKTRKEASRMFFETLVLKTKDYIHVEQKDPFGNINIQPRSKLFKSDF